MSPRSVSDLERGINRNPHKDTAVLLAGALGLTGPAEELFVAAARGRARPRRCWPPRGRWHRELLRPRRLGARCLMAASPAARAAGAAAGSGDRFPVPRAGRVRGAGRGVVFRPGSGHYRGAGPDVAAAGGRGPAGGVGGVGRGQVVAAAGGGAAADPGGRAGSRAGATSWPCLLFTPTRAPLDELALRVAPLAGADAAAVRRGLDTAPAWFALTARQAALARPRGPAGDGDVSAAERRPAAAAAAVAAGGRPVRGVVHPVPR